MRMSFTNSRERMDLDLQEDILHGESRLPRSTFPTSHVFRDIVITTIPRMGYLFELAACLLDFLLIRTALRKVVFYVTASS